MWPAADQVAVQNFSGRHDAGCGAGDVPQVVEPVVQNRSGPRAAGSSVCDAPASTAAGAAPQLTHFTRFLCLPRDEYVQRVQNMIDAHALDDIGQPNLRIEGPTSWGVWLRISEPSRSESGRPCRIRCGVLYHVAQMKVYFHGEEQATRQMLLPLFEPWTYVSLDACPDRRPGAEFHVPRPLILDGPVPSSVSNVPSSADSVPCSEAHPAGPPTPAACLATRAGGPAAPTVATIPGCDPHAPAEVLCPPVVSSGDENATAAAGVPSANSHWALLSQLVGQLVEHQGRMQELLSEIRDRFVPMVDPVNHNRSHCSFAQCPQLNTPGCISNMCTQHCVSQECAVHQCSVHCDGCVQRGCQNLMSPRCVARRCADHCDSGHSRVHRGSHGPAGHACQSSAPVCRRSGCANLISASCVTGYCPNHCVSRRCSCRSCTEHVARDGSWQPAVSSRARACRHMSCTAFVLPTCRTGFCTAHCTSSRCSCCARRSRDPPPPAAGTRVPVPGRTCRNMQCRRLVDQHCQTGFCPHHCRSRACPCHVGVHACHNNDPPVPQPPRNGTGDVARSRTCRNRCCHNVVDVACATGFCPEHCTSPRCSCRNARAAAPHDSVRSARCRRRDCHNQPAASCRTGYCPDHCLNRRCCAGGGSGPRSLRHSPTADPLGEFLTEACGNLPPDHALPPDLQASAHALRSRVANTGNVRGPRRHRQHGGDRAT